MKSLSLIVVGMFLLVGLLAPASPARGRKPKRIAQGAWGGQHITMQVSESSATIEFDCAHAQIDGPLITDRRGRFKLKGMFSPERGGPVRANENSNGQPAHFAGWTDGKKMTLTVTLAGQKESLGTFNLARGTEGLLFKCR
jgi:hypothetical protein